MLDPDPDSMNPDPGLDSMKSDPQQKIAECSETVRITPVFVSQALKRNCQALRRKAKETGGLKQCRVCLDNVDSKRCSGIYSVHVFIGISYYCTYGTSLCSFDVKLFSSCFTCLFSNPRELQQRFETRCYRILAAHLLNLGSRLLSVTARTASILLLDNVDSMKSL